MRLSIYLANEQVRSLAEIIQEEYRKGAKIIKPAQRLDFECLAFIRETTLGKPRWATLLGSHFNLSSLRLLQGASSFVLALKSKGRVFAVTFGYGFTAIERSKIEPRFGLKASLALLDEDKIRTLDSRNIDRLVRQRRTHVSSGSRIWDFGISPSAEWIRYVSGKTATNELGSSVSGSDSLAINCDIALRDIGELCEALLTAYQSDKASRKFDFLDRMQPLPRSSPLIPDLEKELEDRVAKRSEKKLVIAYPDFSKEDSVDHYRVGCGHQSVRMHDISRSEIYAFLDGHPQIAPSVDKIWVVGEDADNRQVTEKRSLRDYLVVEASRGDSVYYLSFGHWHEAARRFVDRVRRQVRELTDDTERLRLPAMHRGEREDEYNERVAKEKGWLRLDKKTFSMGGHNKFEVCDLYTDAGEFVAVKKMRDSANMSHLFAQASVTAALLNAEEEYRRKLQAIVEARWKKKTRAFMNRLFVYALPTEKAGSIAHEMFLFSQVNLLDHVQRIRVAGHRVSLCKIDYGD